ncbi:MAG TPA: dihydroorotate dehydrogenase [Candidatus Atribacteria bacterium]|nr:dihydroorotate dehydrogenase [Candidatus Atribacteria bacterium]
MASGTFGFGREYSEIYDIEKLGGIVSKGLTLYPRNGNQGIRVWETSSGMLNSVGLENPGIQNFIKNELPYMQSLNVAHIINISGTSLDDYVKACDKISRQNVDMIELNISCPNIKENNLPFGIKETTTREVVKETRKVVKIPLMVKLSPDADDITRIARICEEEGADAISLINTFKSFAINVNEKKKIFENTYAGLSGPCIKPIALRMVHEVAKQVKIPVIGIGGIVDYQDVLEFLMAGARAVQIGTANFLNPRVGEIIIKDLENYLKSNNVSNISDIIGIID